MKRNATFPFLPALVLPALALMVASGANADTNNSTASSSASKSSASKSSASEQNAADTETLARLDADADSDAQEATGDGSGSGDADASGPVATDGAAPDGVAPDETADPTQAKKKEDSAGAVSESLEPAKKEGAEKEEKEHELPAGMSAGGVVAGGSSFPLSITVTLTNTVGAGTFVPNAARNPSIGTQLALRPAFQVPNLFGKWQPRSMITGFISAQIEWMSSFIDGGVFGATGRDRQVAVGDGSVSFILPALISEPWTGASITPIFTVRAPISLFSRFQNRLLGGSATAMGGWNTAKLFGAAFGVAGVQAVSSATYWEHTAVGGTVSCGKELPNGQGLFNGGGFTDGTTTFPLAVGRIEEVTSNGECLLAGRQMVGSFSNTVTGFYATPEFFGSHNFAAGASTFHVFLRPLSNAPELRSPFAQPQSVLNTVVFVNYSVSYAYTVPGDWLPFGSNMQLSAGLNTFQPMFDGQGFVRPPIDLIFWSQRETGEAPAGLNLQPSNNFTTGFVTLTVGI